MRVVSSELPLLPKLQLASGTFYYVSKAQRRHRNRFQPACKFFANLCLVPDNSNQQANGPWAAKFSADSNTTPASQTDEGLSVAEKIGYGLGDTASNLYWKFFEYFQLIFYTDVFGISASAAGTMFLTTKLFDAITDPMVGLISDRTVTAWGRFRPFLLWGAIPFAVTGIFTFYTPNFSPTGKLIYAYITYAAVFMAYTVVNIPYGALMGVISSDPVERTSVSTYRFVFAFIGAIIVQRMTEPLVAYFGGSETQIIDGVQKIVVLDKQTGFFWTMVCYAIAAVILFVITFLSTKERVQPVSSDSSQWSHDFKDLVSNGPWLVLSVFSMLQLLAGWIQGSATAYYFTYYVGTSFGEFLVAGTFATIVGTLFAKPLRNWLGAKNLMALSSILSAILTLGFWFIGPDQIFEMYLLQVLGALVGGPLTVLMFAAYADIADYSEWKTNRRATGLIFAAATFSQKIGSAIGGAIPGWCLASYGFISPIDGVNQQQSPATLQGIIAMMSVFPAIALTASALVILIYPLNRRRLAEIQADLQTRKLSADD